MQVVATPTGGPLPVLKTEVYLFTISFELFL
jgi:hypothetical protein